MKRTSGYLIIGMALMACGLAQAQNPKQAPVPVEKELVPPEILMRFRETLRVTPEQEGFLKEQVEAASRGMEKLKARMDEASAALRKVLEADAIDEDLAKARLGDVLDVEREVKQLQMAMMVRINNRLEPEQRRMCRALRKELGPMAVPPEQRDEAQRRFSSKMEVFKRLAQDRFGHSGPPPELPGQVDRVQQLVREGNLPQAEAALDELIGRLKEGPQPERKP